MAANNDIFLSAIEAMIMADFAAVSISESQGPEEIEKRISSLVFSLDRLNDISGNTINTEAPMAMVKIAQGYLSNDMSKDAAEVFLGIAGNMWKISSEVKPGPV